MFARNPSPPPAELLALLNYDPKTGILVWTNTLRGRPAGRRAGSLDKDGYRVVCYAGRTYCAHHLAWWISTGDWPLQILDHANGDPDDNRIDNLRPATPSQNSSNRKLPVTNTSGFRGVVKHHRSGRWNAQIGDGGKVLFLGSFKEPEDAAAAYDKAALERQGAYARLNFPQTSKKSAAMDEEVKGRLKRGCYRKQAEKKAA